MKRGEAIIVDRLGSIETDGARPVIYDREIGMRLLYEDPGSGAEHYLVRYPAGLKAKMHRHTAAQTIVVLEGRLAVNDEIIGPGAYCHFPPGEPPCSTLRPAMTRVCSSPFSTVPATSSPSTPEDRGPLRC
jgi:quercetin dioxygenase-like cupin family protein